MSEVTKTSVYATGRDIVAAAVNAYSDKVGVAAALFVLAAIGIGWAAGYVAGTTAVLLAVGWAAAGILFAQIVSRLVYAGVMVGPIVRLCVSVAAVGSLLVLRKRGDELWFDAVNLCIAIFFVEFVLRGISAAVNEKIAAQEVVTTTEMTEEEVGS